MIVNTFKFRSGRCPSCGNELGLPKIARDKRAYVSIEELKPYIASLLEGLADSAAGNYKSLLKIFKKAGCTRYMSRKSFIVVEKLREEFPEIYVCWVADDPMDGT